MQFWTIVSASTPATVIETLFITDSYGQHPKDKGFAWDAATMTAKRITARPDPSLQTWTGTAWTDVAAKVEAQQIAAVKVEAERRKMMAVTAGGFKKTEYAAKRNEVIAWEALGATAALILAAFNTLSVSVRALRFEYAIADAAKFGDTPADAIARFRAGIAGSASTSAIAATEAKLVADIKSAATPAAKRTIASAAAWPA